MTITLPPGPAAPSDTVRRRRRSRPRPPSQSVPATHPKDGDGDGESLDSEHGDSSSLSSSSERTALPSSPPHGATTAGDRKSGADATSGVVGTADGSVGRLLRFLLCAVGINACYLCHGAVHEGTFVVVREASGGGGQGQGQRPITAFILVTQAATNALAAWAWMSMRRRWRRRRRRGGGGGGGVAEESDEDEEEKAGGRGRAPLTLNHGLLLLTAMSYALAMTCTNEAMRFVSYPTAALCKSCKLLPTMMAGVLVERRNYPLKDWGGALCITAGIVVFNLSRMSTGGGGGDGGVDREDDKVSAVGLFLLFLSLVMDGALGWCQGLLKRNDGGGGVAGGRRMHKHRPPGPLETMMYTNLYATAFFGPYSALTGQLGNGIRLLLSSSASSSSTSYGIGQISCLNLAAAIGQFFIFTTIEWFSPVVCTTITTTRKFFTILISVWRFDHVLTTGQWMGVCLVFGGLYVQIACRVLGGAGGGRVGADPGVADRAGGGGGATGKETKKVK